jgi:hypothetical protein
MNKMKKITHFLHEHRYIFILALLIGLLSSVPQYIEKKTRPDFQGIHMGVVKDTGYYMTRAKEVIDGHSYLTNPYLFEHKDGAPMEFWIPDVIIAKPIQWLGLTISSGFMMWSFVLPLLLALVGYAALMLLTRSKQLSLLGVLFIHLGIYGLKFLRIPSPALNFIFFLIALICLILWIQKREVQKIKLENAGHNQRAQVATSATPYAWASAIAFGLLFNVYTYYWTYFVVLFAVFVFCAIVLRLRNFSYKKYALIFIGGLIVGIPYFVSMWQAHGLEGRIETLERLGLIYSHFPSGIATGALAAGVIVLFLIAYRRKIVALTELNVFLFAALFSTIIVMNQHLITGINLEFSSHYQLGNAYVSIITLIYLISQWLKGKSERARELIFFCLTLIVASYALKGAHGVIVQQITYRDAETHIQRYAPIFQWLNEHAESDEVVFANTEISDYMPLYTSQNVFFAGSANLYFMTNAEVEKRFYINNYFEKFSDEYTLKKLPIIIGRHHINEFGHLNSENKLRKVLGLAQLSNVLIPEGQVERIQVAAAEVQERPFEELLKSYRIDYLVWDTAKDTEWKVKDLKFLELLHSEDGINIYKVNL